MEVILKKMSAQQFKSYITSAVKKYAQEGATATNIPIDQAIEKAHSQFNELLPDGLNSKGQYFFTLNLTSPDETKAIGILWFAEKFANRRVAFIYDIIVDDIFQGKGLGKKSMIAFEKMAAHMGFEAIGLHVFYHNTIACTLYEKLGYQTEVRGEGGMRMIKSLTVS